VPWRLCAVQLYAGAMLLWMMMRRRRRMRRRRFVVTDLDTASALT